MKVTAKSTLKTFYLCLFLLLISCSQSDKNIENKSSNNDSSIIVATEKDSREIVRQGKPVIYQVFTRIFGNRNITNKPWGTIEENGVGKFNDFTDQALQSIKEFGVSHIWYTGVPHHAVVRDYSEYGITNDDPDVIKGRAGSPYAVKDYYNVNPDLATDPANRLQEFKALVDRTHRNGMKVIIDIVPNHIARDYHSITKPEGVSDFGENDDTSVEYKRNNNFYYVVGKDFQVPISNDGYQPLGGEAHPLSDQQFNESPAKWTGNGSRKAQPDINDWYETVKVNYGVRPDGSYDFERLPKDYSDKGYLDHFEFWKDKQVPDSWKKYRDILAYWTDLGVDGFRYDMAEMVPVEFWSYLNSSIKVLNPSSTLIAEIYNPKVYRDYISLGKMDYLYDKVDFYDTLRAVMQGKQPTSNIVPIMNKFADIDQHLLHFLENHDEQRIASKPFAGDANKGKPAMVVTALIGKSPTMLYYAQALGEAGDGDAGFGRASRTTIFDYWGLSSLQRWSSDGSYDASQLTQAEKILRKFYVKLLSFSANNSAFRGDYSDLHTYSLEHTENYNESLYAFARWSSTDKVIVVSNFSDSQSSKIKLRISEELIKRWLLEDGSYSLFNIISSDVEQHHTLKVNQQIGLVEVILEPLESRVLHLSK